MTNFRPIRVQRPHFSTKSGLASIFGLFFEMPVRSCTKSLPPRCKCCSLFFLPKATVSGSLASGGLPRAGRSSYLTERSNILESGPACKVRISGVQACVLSQIWPRFELDTTVLLDQTWVALDRILAGCDRIWAGLGQVVGGIGQFAGGVRPTLSMDRPIFGAARQIRGRL